MKVTLKTITPIHVGNGEKLYDLDYIVTSGYYYRISQGEFLKFLKNYPEHINDYSNWITQTTRGLENFEHLKKTTDKKKNKKQWEDFNQQYNKLKYDFNLLRFIQNIDKTQEFNNFIYENIDYKIPYKIQANELEEFVKGEVRGLLITANEKPYLAGSTIKGAIRTALFYHYLINSSDTNEFIELMGDELEKIGFKIINKKKNGERLSKDENDLIKKIKGNFTKKIEEKAFYCSHNCTNDNSKKTDDEKLDVFKLLLVSDGIIDQSVRNILTIENINNYLVEKEKGNLIAAEKTFTPFVEAIKPNIEIETTINFNIEFLFSIKDKLTEKGIKVKDGYQWIGLAEKVKQVFGLDISTLTKENLEDKRKEVLQYITKAVKQFSERQIKAHQVWIEHFKKHDKEGYAPKVEEGFWLVNHLAKTQNLIHLGFGAGFTGMTALLYVLDNEKLKNKYRDIMEVFGIGNAPNNKGTYIPNPDRFPKSKRLARGQNEIKPLGWLTIVDDKTPKHFSDLKYEVEQEAKKEALKSIQPEYFSGKINHKKSFLIEAEVISSDKLRRTNEIKLFISEDNTPTCILRGNPIEEGRVIIVQVNFSKKLEPTNLSFKSYKK